MMKVNSRRRTLGFTMVELMVSIVLGLLLSAAVISVFISSKRTYNDNERMARLQENGRNALYFLADDLRHANFWGKLIDNSTIDTSSLPVAAGCKVWMRNATNDKFIGSDDPATFITNYGLTACVTNIQAGTSIVAIKRVSSGPTAWGNLDPCDLFLRADSSDAELTVKNGTKNGVNCSGGKNSAPDLTSNLEDWEYQPKIYYVRSYSNTVGDAIPTLCVIRGNTNLAPQCLIEGVEVMHLEYGIDTNDDGVPDVFQNSPTRDAVTADIYILVRDVEPDFLYINTNSYQLGGKTVAAANDNFHRAVFSTTVVAHNQRYLPVR